MDGDEGALAATVAELRRAADELERLRGLVPPGRWSLRGLLATRPEIVAEDEAGRTEHIAEARGRSAAWILAMAPSVAAPLIAWLRETADALDQPSLGTPTSVAAATALASAVLDHPGTRTARTDAAAGDSD